MWHYQPTWILLCSPLLVSYECLHTHLCKMCFINYYSKGFVSIYVIIVNFFNHRCVLSGLSLYSWTWRTCYRSLLYNSGAGNCYVFLHLWLALDSPSSSQPPAHLCLCSFPEAAPYDQVLVWLPSLCGCIASLHCAACVWAGCRAR